MRRSAFRLIAVLLLALAIPAQGWSAVVAGQCMAFGHHDQAAHAHDDHGASHDHEAGAGHDDEGKGAHCGPCAACCASASIAGPAALPILAESSNAKYAYAPLAPPDIRLDELDRPPLAAF